MATNVGGLKELISHGVDGYLTEVGDPEALANCSLEILQNPELQEELGSNARAKVLKTYTPDKIVPQYEDLYKEILQEK